MQKRLAYKYRINPDADTSEKLVKMCGCARFVWNLFLSQRSAWYKAASETYSYALEQANKEIAFLESHYGKLSKVVKDELKKDIISEHCDISLKPSRFQQSRQLPPLKKQYPWLFDECESSSLSDVLENLEKAFDKFYKNPNDGYPKFKKRDDNGQSFSVVGSTCTNNVKIKKTDRGWRLQLPKIKVGIPLRMHREIKGKIKTATIRFDGINWFVSFSTLEEILEPVQSRDTAVGIDLGVVHAVTTSEGKMYKPADSLKRHSKRIKRLNQKLARSKAGSKRRERVKRNLRKKYLKVTRVRNNHIHNITHDLVKSHDIIVMEDLKTSNMTKSAKGSVDSPGKNVKAKSGLNRVILDASFHEYKRQLTYKCLYAGKQLVLVDPRNTSRRCIECGHTDKGNRPSQSRFRCTECGHEANADINAAQNILKRGLNSLKIEIGDMPPLKVDRYATSLESRSTKHIKKSHDHSSKQLEFSSLLEAG